LGDFYLKPLGAPKPVKLMDKEQIKTLGLTDVGALTKGIMTLSSKGSKLALWGTKDPSRKITSIIHVYDLTDAQKLALDKPFKTFRTDESLAAVEWGPDENSLAVVAITNEGIRIKLLDLRTGTWTTLARVAEDGSAGGREEIGMIYSLHHKVMSWSQ
jgi:hypothetical protein